LTVHGYLAFTHPPRTHLPSRLLEIVLSAQWRDRPRNTLTAQASGNATPRTREREFFIANLLVRIHFIIEMSWWTGLAPWEFEFPFPGRLLSTFPAMKKSIRRQRSAAGSRSHPARVQAASACTQTQRHPLHKTVSDRAQSSGFCAFLPTRPPTTSAG